MFCVCWLINWLVLQCSFIRQLFVGCVITERCEWTLTLQFIPPLCFEWFHWWEMSVSFCCEEDKCPISFVWLRTFVLYVPLWMYTPASCPFFGLPCRLSPFTVPCKMILARPDDQETWPYCLRRVGRKKDKTVTERALGVGRWTRKEKVKWNRMTALRFQTGGRHQIRQVSLGNGAANASSTAGSWQHR